MVFPYDCKTVKSTWPLNVNTKLPMTVAKLDQCPLSICGADADKPSRVVQTVMTMLAAFWFRIMSSLVLSWSPPFLTTITVVVRGLPPGGVIDLDLDQQPVGVRPAAFLATAKHAASA